MKIKNIKSGLLTLAVTVFVLFLAGELVLRFLYWRDDLSFRFISGAGRTVGRYQYDPDLGWRNRPDYDSMINWPHGKTREKINHEGLRDREYVFEKPDSVFRVAVLGCSYTYGYAVNLEDTYAKKLEANLADLTDKKVEVINFGVNGYGLAQMFLSYEKNVRKYDPDLVLLQYGWFNSFRTLYSYLYGTHKPAFTVENGSLVLKNHPVPDSRFGWLETRLVANSLFYKFIKEKLMIFKTQRMMRQRFETKKSEKLRNVSAVVLKHFQETATTDNVRLIAFVWGEDAPMLLEICEQAQVEVFNVDDYENQEDWGGREALEFPSPVGHWTPRGHELVAVAISKYLRSQTVLADIANGI